MKLSKVDVSKFEIGEKDAIYARIARSEQDRSERGVYRSERMFFSRLEPIVAVLESAFHFGTGPVKTIMYKKNDNKAGKTRSGKSSR
jgi:hypothetical protein